MQYLQDKIIAESVQPSPVGMLQVSKVPPEYTVVDILEANDVIS